MQSEALMSCVLDGIDNINKELKAVSERIVRVEDTVKRHDEVTFPDMKRAIELGNNAVSRVESKQNEDMVAFVAEKNKVYTEFNERLKPLEAEQKARNAIKTDIKKKVWEATWDWLKLGIVAFVTWVITHYNH